MNNDTDLVLFGARGDLSRRKLFPALYHLDAGNLLPKGMRLLALAREETDTQGFIEGIKTNLINSLSDDAWDEKVWQRLAERVTYVKLDFAIPEDFQALAKELSSARTSIFYLATPPNLFDDICDNMGQHGCLEGDCRVVLEKPIGHNLESCREVNATVAKYFPEDKTYRIDHYLGKETVQNLLVLRFANRFINAQWDQSCIDHVQITVAETVGIEGRWSYYDKVGQLRDMVQNHLMQLLCLVAMEPPNSMTADSIRDEKVKIMRALRPIDTASVSELAVRGQYSAGHQQGKPVPGYMEEEGCEAGSSDTETFVAIKAHIDNWRWAGVPFYLRTGKRMAEKVTEIVIAYKSLPHNIFNRGANIPNRLVIRLQPREGIEMQMVSKLHSLKEKMALEKQNLNLDFYNQSNKGRLPDAYERLFLDAIQGDQSLFVGGEEVEESWRWVDQLIASWKKQGLGVNRYYAGSWGPTKAELLIERDGRSWHE